jgi:4-diphosphocytidyl-2-C-methyl-D-erythritol kinase
MEKLSRTTAVYSGKLSKDGNSIFISAPAKINLFLKVIEKRTDGYHNIYSWFQALDLCDHLEIEKTSSPDIVISTDVDDIPTGSENLVYQAAQRIQEQCDSACGFKIKLWKRIPVGAGLGGGSSDAAAFIKGVDRLLGLGLNPRKMTRIGLDIGSDVPFFFSCGQAEVTGRGDIVRPIQLPTNYQVALVTPPFEIRAAEAYRKIRLDLTGRFRYITFKQCRQAGELFDILSGLENDLEKALRESYPILDKIEEILGESGADIVRISGSGPTMFALYRNGILTKDKLKPKIRGEGWGLNISGPVILPAKQ